MNFKIMRAEGLLSSDDSSSSTLSMIPYFVLIDDPSAYEILDRYYKLKQLTTFDTWIGERFSALLKKPAIKAPKHNNKIARGEWVVSFTEPKHLTAAKRLKNISELIETLRYTYSKETSDRLRELKKNGIGEKVVVSPNGDVLCSFGHQTKKGICQDRGCPPWAEHIGFEMG